MKHLERLPVEGVEVEYWYEGYHITASWPARKGKADVTTNVRVVWKGAPREKVLLSETRINLLSDSAKKGLTATLRKGDPELPVDELTHAIADDLLGWHRQGGRTTQPLPAQSKAGGWLVYPIWPATGATGIAAAPGSYKSFTGQALALQLATGVEILKGNTRKPRKPVNTLFLDWEGDEDTFAERLYGLCAGYGLEPKPWLRYKQMAAPLTDAASTLADEILRDDIKAVVVDSMSASVGGGMVDDDIVNGFWSAVRTLNVPALVITHKSAENISKKRARFFGSIMSEARVRMAWNAETADNGIVWECFKDNHHGKRGAKLAWQIQLGHDGDHEDRVLSSVRFTSTDPANVTIAPEEPRTHADIIADVLADGPMMTGEIAKMTGIKGGSVSKACDRDSRIEKLSDGRWRRRDNLRDTSDATGTRHEW